MIRTGLSPCGLLCWAFLAFTISTTSPAHAGSWAQNQSLGGFSNVHIYTPDTSSSIGSGKSLLIVLHGCTQAISSFLTANLEDAAEAHGMVVAVPDAMNKAGFSCWSYWQGAISRNSGDYQNLIGLANAMSSDPGRNIDPDQVYIAGLSSGAAFAAQTACLAPDVFAGVAPSAGPTIGTSSNGAISTCETVSPTTFKSRCESYAGSAASAFATQLAVIAHGTADTTVNTCYNQQNANGFANVYGVSQLAGSGTITDSPGHTADEHLWQNNRVAMLWLNGLDHSWSGGEGASGSYVAGSSINFATYLGAFFSEHNLRVDRNAGPVISNHAATEQGDGLWISGNAVDAEGSVDEVSIAINAIDTGTPQLVETLSASASPSDGFYSQASSALVDGLYEVVAVAIDDEGKAGESASVTARVGPEPPPQAPVLSGLDAEVNGQCATISGSAVDANLNLDTVVVDFGGTSVTATLTGNDFSAEQCNLPGGSQSATVTATDSGGLSSSDSITFEIDAGSTGDYNHHIAEGHITWGDGYSACYLAFGTASFTMREVGAGAGQCEWVADGEPSCNGPAQACSGGGSSSSSSSGGSSSSSSSSSGSSSSSSSSDSSSSGSSSSSSSSSGGSSSGGGHTCSEVTSSNYAHVQAGRATTNGFYAYAVGSGTSLGLYNIFYSSTLAETAPGYYDLGSCP